jgi:hypothetical protein
VDAQSECAHSVGVFCVKSIHVIIWDISYHGYHGLRPRIRLAHSALATVTLSDEKPHVNVCTERRAQGRGLLGSIWALGGPTCHVRHVYLTPNVIRSLSCRRTPGELGRTPTVCKDVCVPGACLTFHNPCPPLPASPLRLAVGLCAFPILGHARPIGRRALYDGVLPGRYNVR